MKSLKIMLLILPFFLVVTGTATAIPTPPTGYMLDDSLDLLGSHGLDDEPDRHIIFSDSD